MPLDVLIVDDSAITRKILGRVIAQSNLPLGKILEAGDGCEALDTLERQNVGLILADIQMPNMDGLELLEKLKASDQWKNVPVIMISAQGSQAKVKDAIQLGACGYVLKPFRAEHIKQKLASIL